MTIVPRVLSREDQFECLIEGLLDRGYGVCDHFLEPDMVSHLQSNLLAFREAKLMHPARIGRKFDLQQNSKIRGDAIKWIDPSEADPNEKAFFDLVEGFIAYLNRTCYTGINAYEFHYAYYGPGSFYKRHLDQFKNDRGRKYSLVMYLNANWQPEDGGQLVLYPKGRGQEVLQPLAGRAVFFRSDELEHEVLPAQDRYRMSIAGWLKSV